jgi:hypothetical protein
MPTSNSNSEPLLTTTYWRNGRICTLFLVNGQTDLSIFHRAWKEVHADFQIWECYHNTPVPDEISFIAVLNPSEVACEDLEIKTVTDLLLG